MIHLDVTKTARASHLSGLMRVNRRLQQEMGSAARPVQWPDWDRRLESDDWFLTAELFSERERPGITEFIALHRDRVAAVYHDAIPLKFPHITWPQSVARQPEYLKLLAGFARVFAVSAASRDELVSFWRWQGVTARAQVDLLSLGADFDGHPRVVEPDRPSERRLLCLGIVEPRKNQSLLLQAVARLWDEGLGFELDLVGRINPHFGPPIREAIRRLQAAYPSLHYRGQVGDAELGELFRRARATVFPTLAEGCGLPLLESLWRGVPCICSDLPVLREQADAGGCLAVPVNDLDAWTSALRRVISDDGSVAELARAARARPLPRWTETAAHLRAALR